MISPCHPLIAEVRKVQHASVDNGIFDYTRVLRRDAGFSRATYIDGRLSVQTRPAVPIVCLCVFGAVFDAGTAAICIAAATVTPRPVHHPTIKLVQGHSLPLRTRLPWTGQH